MQAATEHASSLSLSMKMCFLGMVGIFTGLALLIGGAPVAAIVRPEPGKSSVLAYMIGIVLAVLGVIAFFHLKSHLESLGYVFDR